MRLAAAGAVPLALSTLAFGVWFGCFVVQERLLTGAVGDDRPFPWDQVFTRRHAVAVALLLATAFYAFDVSATVLLGLAFVYGIVWSADDRASDEATRVARNLASPRRRAVLVVTHGVECVTYLLGVTLLAIAAVDALR